MADKLHEVKITLSHIGGWCNEREAENDEVKPSIQSSIIFLRLNNLLI
jgi:hypothetical protein